MFALETEHNSGISPKAVEKTALSSRPEFWRATHWFAVQTKPRREELAATSIRGAGLDVLLPKSRRRAEPPRPLFPGYVFARFCPWRCLDAVRYSRGVLRVVSSGTMPLPVPDETVSELRHRMNTDGFIMLTPPSFQPGDQVVVHQGPLQGLLGRVEHEWDGGRRVMILLGCLLHSQTVVDKSCLAPAAGAT